MRDRRAEQGHHGVPDELLHRAAESLELRPQPLVVRPQNRCDILRIELFGTVRKTDEVGE